MKIDRYAGLDQEGMQAEYEWALDMATLCLQDPDAVPDQGQVWTYPIEFQRHAGRTARYRGFGEQAVEDYERAIEYAYRVEDLFPPHVNGPEDWEITVLRDIADTYLLMGAYELAAELSKVIIDLTTEVQHPRGQETLSSTYDLDRLPAIDDLDRLAQIAQHQRRFAEGVTLQQRGAWATEQRHVSLYLDQCSELRHIDRTQPWSVIVRHPDVRGAMRDDDNARSLRVVYHPLARALRLSGQLAEVAYTLETAELTPWKMKGTWRANLDLCVDREWAFLALDRGDAGEAIRRGNECLTKYAVSIHPSERIELIDLVSRALEQLGQLQAARDRLKEAIAIVEQRRANLVVDEYKQSYGAQCADLYRRAAELVIKIGQNGWPTSSGGGGADDPSPTSPWRNGAAGHPDDPSPTLRFAKNGAPDMGHPTYDQRTVAESFQWAERAKGRAMLDAMRRLDRRMALARDRGDVEAIKHTRDLAGEMVTIDDLQTAPWWSDQTALAEYMLTDRGAWVWIVTATSADLHAIAAPVDQIEQHANALRKALQPGAPPDQSWKQPAAWLYDTLIRPIDRHLADASHLVIVADGVLREIPFETFIDRSDGNGPGERLLIERLTVSYAPSATILQHISRRPPQREWTYDYWGFASTRFRSTDAPGAPPPPGAADVGRGAMGKRSLPVPKTMDPVRMILRSVRNLDLPPLPQAEKEVIRSAAKFPQNRRRVFINYQDQGRTAKDVLLSAGESGELAGVRHLHFATHTLLDSDRPFDSGLVLSPPYVDVSIQTEATKNDAKARDERSEVSGFSNLGFRSTRVSRQACILSLREIADLDLGCELVVLSSCQALGGSPVDGDWLTGLTRAFFVAGSDAVICTLWDVVDATAQQITPTTFWDMRFPNPPSTGTPAESLRQAKLILMDLPGYSHPSNWSGFVCYGGLPKK